MQYDYLIVGAGLYGAVFARQMTDAGKKCLVIERRGHIAGNAYTLKTADIDVHVYGAHIFHTSNERVWMYVNRFSAFNSYIHTVMANYRGELYNLPFNMNTFARMWGVATPQQAREIIERQRAAAADGVPRNLREQAIRLVGTDIYEKLIRGYTLKQWGRPCEELPPFIIRRLPVRYTFDNRYFNDVHQGVPESGYTALFSRLLSRIEVRLNTDYLLDPYAFSALAKKTVFTGAIDSYFGYSLGHLAYRSLRFESETLETPNFQGCAVMNYTDAETPYTRIIEHKHFTFGMQPQSVITREYPVEWTPGTEPYYPVNDAPNQLIYDRYLALAKAQPSVLFGGRLGEYRYADMDAIVLSALEAADRETAL
ncbi:MAG: UDP-galactopyranose mutase [Clostridiaceae bacterium]